MSPHRPALPREGYLLPSKLFIRPLVAPANLVRARDGIGGPCRCPQGTAEATTDPSQNSGPRVGTQVQFDRVFVERAVEHMLALRIRGRRLATRPVLCCNLLSSKGFL